MMSLSLDELKRDMAVTCALTERDAYRVDQIWSFLYNRGTSMIVHSGHVVL